jgi:LPXTG-motif cell wall-anchored protein
MNKLVKMSVVGLTCAVLGLSGLPTAANASTPWPDPIINGDFKWRISSGFDSYSSTDVADVYESQFVDTGLLEFSDGVNEDSRDYGCVDPVESPGSVTTDGADTIVTCAPFDIPSGTAGTGLTVTPQLRILDSLHVARQLFKVENTTGAAITVPTVGMRVNWEHDTPLGLSSTGARGDGTNDTPIADADRWVITSGGDSYMPSGVVWAAACHTDTYTVKGHDSYRFHANASSPQTFAAGSTTYFVTFLQMEIPTAETDAAQNAAFDRLGATFDTRFATLSDELSVGIPDGSTVRFWNDGTATCAAQLPNTGLDASVLTLGALGLLAAGAITTFAIRRRTV